MVQDHRLNKPLCKFGHGQQTQITYDARLQTQEISLQIWTWTTDTNNILHKVADSTNFSADVDMDYRHK
jgi:hypothetical protein